MQDDQAIWNAIGEKGMFCSFRMATETESLCKNANNVTGYCNRSSCPLANSKYATVREFKGRLYLMMKEPERAHKPGILYEKVELSQDYDAAAKQISAELKRWKPWIVHKCKQRLTKLAEYLERKEHLEEMGRPAYIKKNRKMERQDRAREKKAATAAKIEKAVQEEVLERYRAGIYGDKVVLEQEVKTEADRKREKRFRRQLYGVKYVSEFEADENEEEAVHKKKARRKITTMEW